MAPGGLGAAQGPLAMLGFDPKELMEQPALLASLAFERRPGRVWLLGGGQGGCWWWWKELTLSKLQWQRSVLAEGKTPPPLKDRPPACMSGRWTEQLKPTGSVIGHPSGALTP